MNLIVSALENSGFKAKLVSLKIIDDIKSDIEKRFRAGEIDTSLFNRYFNNFEYIAPADVKSILIVAIPRPQIHVEFTFQDQTKTLTIPPTYTGYNSIPRSIETLLANLDEKNNLKFIRTKLPEKSLAVRCGLAFYGRNNITFIPGFGSFYQLVSFYTSIETDIGDPQEPRMLERCNHCVACVNVCPTNAISTERFLIHAEKCLTFFNENKGEFPDWIDNDAHNSLVGCILCQKFCPENKQVRDWSVSKIHFNEEETNSIINSNDLSGCSQTLREKIISLDLIETHINFDSFKRNLTTLIYRNDKLN